MVSVVGSVRVLRVMVSVVGSVRVLRVMVSVVGSARVVTGALVMAVVRVGSARVLRVMVSVVGSVRVLRVMVSVVGSARVVTGALVMAVVRVGSARVLRVMVSVVGSVRVLRVMVSVVGSVRVLRVMVSVVGSARVVTGALVMAVVRVGSVRVLRVMVSGNLVAATPRIGTGRGRLGTVTNAPVMTIGDARRIAAGMTTTGTEMADTGPAERVTRVAAAIGSSVPARRARPSRRRLVPSCRTRLLPRTLTAPSGPNCCRWPSRSRRRLPGILSLPGN